MRYKVLFAEVYMFLGKVVSHAELRKPAEPEREAPVAVAQEEPLKPAPGATQDAGNEDEKGDDEPGQSISNNLTLVMRPMFCTGSTL